MSPDSPATLAAHLQQRTQRVEAIANYRISGKIVKTQGLAVEAAGFKSAVGERCLVEMPKKEPIVMEVVGFHHDRLFLMPIDAVEGLEPGARVWPIQQNTDVSVGPELLGRVIDALGNPLDGLGEILAEESCSLQGHDLNPLSREPIREPIDVGVRAINALLTAGKGQRLGLFAGSGVGKSVLLGMMTRYTNADVVVVGLIGERGREVKDFIEESLGDEGLKRAIVVAAPANEPPLKRLHAAMRATAIAEYYRNQGKNVLLLMDSLTRFAQAQREIGLSIGEPPANKGYPPSVFFKLPQLVERAGTSSETGGSITAFYTVLMEGDDQQDPISDSARAILDGHIVLSRRLAESGVYPAIDVESSISRVMPRIISQEQQEAALLLKSLMSIYHENQELINIGAVQQGNNQLLDLSMAFMPQVRSFISQSMGQSVSLTESQQTLKQLSDAIENAKAVWGQVVSEQANG